MSPPSQQELEQYLWGAANLLRGYIDAGDYKQYIFPLLFYKRICDVHDEEYQRALEDADGDVEYAKFDENYRFKVPDGSHWNDTREVTKDVGFAIQKSLRELEKYNPDTLYGIFGDAQWTNKDRLSDATLRDLIEHFSSLSLSLENVPQDQLGEAYEYLIKKFADDSGHTAAEFYTNRTLVRLMTLIMDPRTGESIYDPTCGTGGMLLVAVLQVKNKGEEYRSMKLFGQEINLITSAIARMNLFLHGVEDFSVVRGDTLSQPAFIEDDELKKFDVILANPPYSIKQWDRKAWTKDPWGRNIYGTPPQGRADYAFFQHIIKSMDPETGRCAILFPNGVLFREAEQKMRKKMVEDDIIDCILGLGPNLFYNSSMEACVVFCKMKKPPEKKGKILFINALEDIRTEKTQSFLDKEHIEKIHAAYTDYDDIDYFSKVVTLDEIKSNNYDLSVNWYAPLESEGFTQIINSEKDLKSVINNWEENSLKLKAKVKDFLDVLGEVGLDG